MIKTIGYLCLLIFSINVNALVPLESLILGDFSEKYDLAVSDPLHYIYNFATYASNEEEFNKDKEHLVVYRGFYEEGQNLVNFCEKKTEPVIYSAPFDRDQVKRTLVSTAQYIGLDITVRALAKYGQFFEFSDQEYENLTNHLVGNYCSENLSVISKRQLRKVMIKHFKDDSGGLALPTVKGNRYFAEKVEGLQTEDKKRRRELYYTVNLFKSFCSWSGDADDLGIMVHLIQNPLFYTFVERQLTGKKLTYDKLNSRVKLERSEDTVQVGCQNLICRKKSFEQFNIQFPKSVGHSSIKNDLNGLYCEDFSKMDFNFKIKDQRLKKFIDSTSFDEKNLMVSHLIALLTGVPDFFLWQRDFKDLETLSRLSLEQFWTKWAQSFTDKLGKDIYYEEALTMELVDRNLYYHPSRPDFKVVFDVNLGEFDRVNQIAGKVKSSFEIKLTLKFLKWARKVWQNYDPREPEVKEELDKQFLVRIAPLVQKIQKKFIFAPWSQGLEKIILKEILYQIAHYNGDYFSRTHSGIITIPIEINFAPFALGYMRYQQLTQKAVEKEEREEKIRQSKKRK